MVGRVLLLIVLIWAIILPMTADVHARAFRPAVLFNSQPEDGAFNQAVYDGILKFTRDSGVECEIIEAPAITEGYSQALDKAVADGFDPIIVPYGHRLKDLPDKARKYRDNRFITLDVQFDQPNIHSFTFGEHEGSFLAGALAALMTRTGVVGFVGAKDIEIIRRFSCGFRQGVQYVDPGITVLVGFVGSDPSAWFNTEEAGARALEMMDTGADIIFQAAGHAGLGVLKAVAENGGLGIGVDVNQNGYHPGKVLTSMIKRVDLGIYAALQIAAKNQWRDNIKRLGLRQGVVGLVFDKHNEGLVPQEILARIDEIRGDILMGRIRVYEFGEEGFCPSDY